MRLRLFAGIFLLAIQAFAQANTELYYVAFLRPAPDRRLLAREDGERLQAAHMANIRKMAADGILVAAGPFEDNPVTISGIFIMKAASLDEARRIARQDPTVVEKRNTIDVHPWRGPAGIGEEYQRLHKADPKTPENMGVHPIVFIRPGPNWSKRSGGEPTTGQQMLEQAIDGLRRAGNLVAGGAIQGEDDFKGLLIFQRISLKTALDALKGQPGMDSGVLKAEPHEFYSAAHVFPW